MNQEFKEYLLEEYDQIAGAHFNMVQTISVFFKHYLLIMAIPATIVSFFFSKGSERFELTRFADISNLIIGSSFLIISIIGYFVCLYIINMRLDAILYARTINGIRKFFYLNSGLSEEVASKIRLLPQNIYTPRYRENKLFLPVVFSFSVINSLYLAISIIFILLLYLGNNAYVSFGSFVFDCYAIPAFFFVVGNFGHYYSYTLLSHYREYGYLSSNIIGIDIDGVLNKHREMFCDVLYEKTNIKIQPNNITHIPVHESGLGIERRHELEVFNSPHYWIDMPSREDISSNIKKLKRGMNFNIQIFTYRPWPEHGGFEESYTKKNKLEWQNKIKNMLKDSDKLGTIERAIIWLEYFYCSKIKLVKLIDIATKLWLKENDVVYDKLIVEKGTENIEYKKGKFINRFKLSGEKIIKYFIEDDYEKAIRLSYICDIVFLIDHPYNQDRNELPRPKNVIRVQNWNEIYRKIRVLLNQ